MLESEISEAKSCLNLFFADDADALLFNQDNPFSREVFMGMWEEMKLEEKKKLEEVKQLAFKHAQQNSMNAF